MQALRFCTHIASLAAVAILTIAVNAAAAEPGKGLYGDEAKEVTSGDLNSQDYWWAKFDAMMLELAIQQHQPEGRIAVDLASSIRRLEDLQKAYPKHEEIKKWKARADEVMKKIDENANRQVSFNAGCPWDEANFAQLWVNFRWGKMLYEAKDYNQAYTIYQNVMQNYKIMLQPDRMKDYPEDLRKWVVESKPEADKIFADLQARNH